MRLNGFGKYIDVDELWPNKNACSAFASSFATTENAAWQCPTDGGWQSSHHHPPLPLTSSCVGTISLPASLEASIGSLTSVLNSYPWRETNAGTFLPYCRAPILTYRSNAQVARLPGTVACILYVTPAHSSETDTTYTHLPINMESSRDTNTAYIHMCVSTKMHDLWGQMPHTYTCTHLHINTHIHVSSMQPPMKQSINLHCIELAMNF